jgi:hypothetical protein
MHEAEAFIPLFQILQSITVELQSSGLTLAEARILFDDVLREFPETQRWLAEDCSIKRNPAFEKAIVKVLNEKENELTEEEAKEGT